MESGVSVPAHGQLPLRAFGCQGWLSGKVTLPILNCKPNGGRTTAGTLQCYDMCGGMPPDPGCIRTSRRERFRPLFATWFIALGPDAGRVTHHCVNTQQRSEMGLRRQTAWRWFFGESHESYLLGVQTRYPLSLLVPCKYNFRILLWLCPMWVLNEFS